MRMIFLIFFICVLSLGALAQQNDANRFMMLDGTCIRTLLACSGGDDCNTTTCYTTILDMKTGKATQVLKDNDTPTKKKYFVTGPSLTQNTPATCFGQDRLDALTRCGFTVWTEREWIDVQKILKDVK